MPPTPPVLLYDGVCGFCDATVKTILRHDRRNTLRFAALQSPFAAGVVARHPHLAGMDTVVWVEEGEDGAERVLTHSDAALRVAGYLGFPWSLARVGVVVPRSIRDAAYRLFARHRYRVFGRFDACPIPPPEVRARFVDDAPPPVLQGREP